MGIVIAHIVMGRRVFLGRLIDKKTLHEGFREYENEGLWVLSYTTMVDVQRKSKFYCNFGVRLSSLMRAA